MLLSLIVLLLIIVIIIIKQIATIKVMRIGMGIVSIINGMNHSEDKRQETGTPLSPIPPPLGVVFLPLVTTRV